MRRIKIGKLLTFICIGIISLGFVAVHSAGIQKEDEEVAKVIISGIWESNIGWKYNIKQKGSKFTWTVINRKQKAAGLIKNDKDIEVTWKDNGSKGTAIGLILEVDQDGKATFIEWDNGVFFHRSKKT